MNYFLQLNEKSPHGLDTPRYHLGCGGHTTNVAKAWTTTSLYEAQRVRFCTWPKSILISMTDKELFKAKLKGEVRIS